MCRIITAQVLSHTPLQAVQELARTLPRIAQPGGGKARPGSRGGRQGENRSAGVCVATVAVDAAPVLPPVLCEATLHLVCIRCRFRAIGASG